MRAGVFMMATLFACGHADEDEPSGPCPPNGPSGPSPGPTCSSTCGNGQIDDCWVGIKISTCTTNYIEITEECEGADPTCDEIGYFGSAGACTATCHFSRECEACAPASLACVNATSGATFAAASGDRVAVGAGAIAIFDGTTIVKTVGFSSSLVGIVGTSTGWLLAFDQPARLSPITLDGTLGTLVSVPGTLAGAAMARLGNRVLIASRRAEGTDDVIDVSIHDEAGATVVAPFELFRSASSIFAGATTDGTSFFVGTNGAVARIALDGTHTVTSGFPTGAGPRLAWGGTTGWYIADGGAGLAILQRFDVMGTPLGAPIINTVLLQSDFVGDGADLLALRSSSYRVAKRFEFLRIHPDGTVGLPSPAGAGTSTSALVVRSGTDLVVTWQNNEHTQVARLPVPP